MKVKLLKHKGFFQLAVADERINNLYSCTNNKPIILASLSNKEPSSYWRLKDIRLCEEINPLSYLLESSTQKYKSINQEDFNNLTSQLERFSVNKEGEIIWILFDGVVCGDKTNDLSNPYYHDHFQEGYWSFKEGMKKINEMKEFWTNFQSDDLTIAKTHNPYKQISAFDYQLANNHWSNKPITTNKKVKISIQ